MSIIQSIRDKAAWIVIAAIALALIAFIVQDAFQNGNLFSGSTTTLGTINGTKVDVMEYEEKVKRAEEAYREQGYPMNEMMRNNIREGLWNEYIDDVIMESRYEKLGIHVYDKELSDILYGANPPQDLRRQFTDPNTGIYDANAAYQQIQALKKEKGSPRYASFYGQYLPALAKNRQREKYTALLANSVYAPKWLIEKISADNTQKATIDIVAIPYNTIADSLVKVSDESISKYIKENPEQYKQEATRSIQYVVFDASPTTDDSAAIKDQVGTLKPEFETTGDVSSFLVRNGSETQFVDAYEQKSRITSEFVEELVQLQDNQVFGPYAEGGNYKLAKMLSKRNAPDSVKVRHILIKTEEGGRPVLEDSIAKKRIDSIEKAIKGGADFGLMVAEYSDDDGSKGTAGEYDFILQQYPNISKEFAEVAFYGVTGDKKVVKVRNSAYAGYHYIEVLRQRAFAPSYKLAYFSRAIVPSDETTTRENGLAAQFAAESRNKKQFDENLKKYNYTPLIATDLKPLDATIMGLGNSRELVKWVNEAKIGDVADHPFQVEDKFVVPVLTRIYEEGLMPVEKARPLVESILRNQEKAKQIIAKVGNVSTIEEAAKKMEQTVQRIDSLMFHTSFIPNIGQESKIIGASFNKANQTKVSNPIAGNGAVFVIKVESIGATAGDMDIDSQRTQFVQSQSRAFSDPRIITEILKKSAKIEDNRAKFF